MTTCRVVLATAIVVAACEFTQQARGSDEAPARAVAGDLPVWRSEDIGGGAKARVVKMMPQRHTVVEEVVEEMSPEEVADINRYRELVKAAKEAGSEAESQKAREELRKGLDELFQRDMERREKVVAEAEARVKKLREQIERRKTARSEIVELRVKTILNDADGLEFGIPFDPSAAGNHGFGVGGGTGRRILAVPPPLYVEPQPIDGMPSRPLRRQQLSGSSGMQPVGTPTDELPNSVPVIGSAGRMGSSGRRGKRDDDTISTDERVRILIRNLSHEKESRSIFAADELGKLGLKAKSAVDALKNRMDFPPGAANSPSDALRAACKRALERINEAIDQDDAKKLGIQPEPEPSAPNPAAY
ncbi:MAG: hypothetical protein AB7O26_03720 [Planctomycetaceae bacterium]